MLKAGFVGTVPDAILDAVSLHGEFELTGVFDPGRVSPAPSNTYENPVPLLTAGNLFKYNDVLIIQKTGADVMEIIIEGIRNSKHILLMDTGGLSRSSATKLLKLQRESQTVVRVRHPARNNPAVQVCKPLITHPSLTEIKLMTPGKKNEENREPVRSNILKMLDALLFLCPHNIQKINSLRHFSGMMSSGLVNARIEFDNGSVASVLSSEITEKEIFSIFIYQDNMMIELDLIRPGLRCIEKNGDGVALTYEKEYKNTTEDICHNELTHFYNSIINDSDREKDIFETSRLLELSQRIMEKTFSPEIA